MNRSWKPVFALFALLLTFYTLTTGAQAEKKYTSKKPLQYAVDDFGVWIREDDQLLYWPQGDSRATSMISVAGITHITAEGSTLYYTTQDEEGNTSLHAYSNVGYSLFSNVAIPKELNVLQIESCKQILYLLAEEQHDADHDCSASIYEMHPYWNSIEPLKIADWKNENVTAFSIYGQQLIAQNEQGLTLIDLANRTRLYKPVSTSQMAYVQVGYRSEEAVYAFGIRANDMTLVKIDMETGTEETIPDKKIPQMLIGLRRDKTHMYALNDTLQELHELSIFDMLGLEKKHLVLGNCLSSNNASTQAAIDLFHQKYPDIEIVFRQINDPRVMATELMAGTGDIDMISMQENMMPACSAQLLRAGVIADLSNESSILSRFEYYENMWNCVSTNGHLYGIPETIYMYLWTVDKELAELIGWTPPRDRWTWHDFDDLARRIQAYNETADTPVCLLEQSTDTPVFFYEYISNCVDPYMATSNYQSDELIWLLNMWKHWTEQGLIVQRTQPSGPRTLLAEFEYSSVGYANLSMNNFALPPVESDESFYPIQVVSLVVNETSRLREEAIYFLSCLLSPELHEIQLARGPHEGILLQEEYCWRDGFNVYIEEDEIRENIYKWKYALTHGAPNYMLWDILLPQGKLFPQFVDGKITAEEFVSSSQQLIMMMLGD